MKTHPYIYSGLPSRQQILTRLGRKTDDIETIIEAICSVLNVGREELVSRKRTRRLAEARCIAIGLILSVNPNVTLVSLGKLLGGRDHSTIIYNRDLYGDLYKSDKIFTEKTNKVLTFI